MKNQEYTESSRERPPIAPIDCCVREQLGEKSQATETETSSTSGRSLLFVASGHFTRLHSPHRVDPYSTLLILLH